MVAEERLRTRAAKVFSKIERADTKRKKATLKDGFSIHEGEVTMSTIDLIHQVKSLEEEVENVTKDAMKYKDHCKSMMEVANKSAKKTKSSEH